MKQDIRNMAASVRARLQNRARETSRPFAEILQYYGMERFLYRFGLSRFADTFILKGALLFTVWQLSERRATMDIDFLARYDRQAIKIRDDIREVCRKRVVSDGLVFDSASVAARKIKENADYEGVRVKFTGFLERARIPMQIDVGFNDAVYPQPRVIDYPTLLDFPGPRLKGYPPESVVSEKFEAMITLGPLNSRMKDFFDIWLMTRQFDFDGPVLAEALRQTFARRKTALPERPPFFDDDFYDKASDRQVLWKAFLLRNGIGNAPLELGEIARVLEQFLAGPIQGIFRKQPFQKKWKASGPWKRTG